MADDYTVKVTTLGDDAGAKKVADALGKVTAGTEKQTDASGKSTRAARETSEATRSLGDDLGSLGSRQNATKDVVEGLDSALKGNAASFFGVAKAARNMWEVLTVSTPMGRMIQLALIAVNVFAALAKQFSDTKQDAEALKKEADELSARFDKMAEAKTIAFAKELDALKESAKGAADELDRVFALREKLEAGSREADAAKDDPTLTKTENVMRRQAEEEREVSEKRRTEELKAGQAEGEALDAFRAAKTRADEVQSKLDAAKTEGEKFLQAQRDAKNEIGRINRELEPLQRMPGGTSPEAMARGEQMADLVKQREGLEKQLKQWDTPENQRFVSEQAKIINSLKKAAEEAGKAAEEAEKKWQALAKTTGALRADGSAGPTAEQGIIRRNEDRARRGRQEKELREAIADDQKAGVKVPLPAFGRMFGLQNDLDGTPREPTTTTTGNAPASIKIGGRDYPAAARETQQGSLIEIGSRSGDIAGVTVTGGDASEARKFAKEIAQEVGDAFRETFAQLRGQAAAGAGNNDAQASTLEQSALSVKDAQGQERLAAAVEKVAGAIEIGNKRWNDAVKRLENLESVTRAGNRGN